MRPLATLLLAVALLFATPSTAQKVQLPDASCLDKGFVVEGLQNTFGERLVIRGISNRGWAFEVYGSSEGTWTLVLTRPNKCVFLPDAGTELELITPPLLIPPLNSKEL